VIRSELDWPWDRPQRVQQRLDVPALVDRHQPVAHLVGGGVKRHRQLAADLLGVRAISGTTPLVDSVIRRRDSDAFGIHRDLHRVAHVLEIVERLAHAHQHDVRQKPGFILGARAGFRPFAQIVARHHDLADDLARGEVAHQLLRAGVAEGTGQRAADLARNAQRAAILLGDVDDLDLVPAGDAHEVFARAVVRDLFRRPPRGSRSRMSRPAPRDRPWRGSSSAPKSRTPH
jgi:hypothetical protein